MYGEDMRLDICTGGLWVPARITLYYILRAGRAADFLYQFLMLINQFFKFSLSLAGTFLQETSKPRSENNHFFLFLTLVVMVT